jgi:hypothetical protein
MSAVTLAQLLYPTAPDLDLRQIADDLATAFRRSAGPGRLSWDHDDVAILDICGARIVIGYGTGLRGGHAACFTVAVGRSPGAGASAMARRHDRIARLIADRLRARYPADVVLWHEAEGTPDADLIDGLLDRIEAPPQAAPARGPFPAVVPAAMPAPAGGGLSLSIRAGRSRVTAALGPVRRRRQALPPIAARDPLALLLRIVAPSGLPA